MGSRRKLPKSLIANSETHLTGRTGHQWTQLLLQLLAEASEQLSGISTWKHVTGSWWSVQTPACHYVRDSASVGRVQWCDDSSKSSGVLDDPLCLWWYVVSHFLAYPSRHQHPCIVAAVWIWYSGWHRRVQQHLVASIQPLYGQWLLPDPPLQHLYWSTKVLFKP